MARARRGAGSDRARFPRLLSFSRMPSCPVCARKVGPLATNPGFPFCSPRCKQVDLGKWLDEAYRISSDPSEDEDESSPESPTIAEHPNQEKA